MSAANTSESASAPEMANSIGREEEMTSGSDDEIAPAGYTESTRKEADST
jgi:hypothetical protein